LLFDFEADRFEIKSHLLENVHGHSLAEFDQAEEKVFGADEVMVEPVGLLPRESQDLLRPRREIVHRVIAHSAYLFNA